MVSFKSSMLFARAYLPSAAVIFAIAAETKAICFFRCRLPRAFSFKAISSAICPSTSVGTMGSSDPSLLIICNKLLEENELAQSSLNKWRALKLLDEERKDITVLFSSEVGSDELFFHTELYMKALTTSHFGRFLIWSPRLPSTHDIVARNFGELPVGTVCVADIQFKGRGRGKNVWESPAGCLLFSFTVQMKDGHKLPLLQYVVSLAVTEAIKEACQAKGLPKLDVRIKWPNDLYLNGLKVGGILCTSTYRSKKFDVCAGIGLNVDNEKPTTCLNGALQEICSLSHRLTREDILAAFFNKFEELFEVFLNEGFQALEDLYYETWLHSGQKVVIEDKHEGQSGADILVTIQGLTSSGYLFATDEDGNNYELHPDGNSFDFFKGLVSRKLS